MDIAIIKYNAGNIQSVLYALERIGVNAKVTDNAETIQKADRVIEIKDGRIHLDLPNNLAAKNAVQTA